MSRQVNTHRYAFLGDDRQPDPAGDRGRLHDHPTRLQLPFTLRRFDHAERDTVLDRAAGVQVLDLDQHVSCLRDARGDGLQPDQRRVPHHIGQRVVDLHVALPLVNRCGGTAIHRRYLLRVDSEAVNVSPDTLHKEAQIMPEAVVVAAARSPIGRAFKGSLTSIRPDDLLAQMVSAALAKVPALDPASGPKILSSAAACPAVSRGSTSRVSPRSCSAWTPCRGRPSTGTAPPRCSPPGWPITRSRPARATC